MEELLSRGVVVIKAKQTDSILEVGHLKGRGTSHDAGPRYTIRFLSEDDLQAVVKLQEIVLQNLKDPELYYASSPEKFRRYLSNSLSIGVVIDNVLVGYAIAYIPRDEQENLGMDIGMSREDLQKVVHFQSSAVHPEYRGSSFQNKLIYFLFNVLSDTGYYHALCTISPKNYYSLRNTLRSGFVIKEIKEKFGGLLRCILYKNISLRAESTWQDVVSIRSLDIEGQKELLKDGYLGFDVSKRGHEFLIHYGKSLAEA